MKEDFLKIYHERKDRFLVVKKILNLLEKDNSLRSIEINVYMEIIGALRKVNLYKIALNLEENILINNKNLIYSQLKEDLEEYIKSQP
jgi:hypothetical protein